MKIVVATPPNFAEISAAFPHASDRGVIFAYGDTVYNPSGVDIPPQIIAHEGIHEDQQRVEGGPAKWWCSYIDDVQFRAAQELPAHRREYQVFCDRVKDRNTRAKALHMIAARLSGPLYGGVMSFAEARQKLMAL